MINSDKNFIKYYDKLFQKKDYQKETDFILKAFDKYGKTKLNLILDLGCGTGNHTLEFSKLGYNITGIDIDKLMIEVAQKKSSNTTFILADITNYKFDKKFDLIFSFFNVINYLGNLFFLKKFFTSVHNNLENGGIFVFDCWNGSRVCIDPPEIKKIEINEDNFSAVGTLEPNYDQLMSKSNFHYEFNITEGNQTFKVENTLPQTYWTPLILEQILQESGFPKIIMCKNLSLSDVATINDYKLCWVCIK